MNRVLWASLLLLAFAIVNALFQAHRDGWNRALEYADPPA